MSWKDNPIMTWNGNKITDHGREPLSVSSERFGTDQRMHNGSLRRFNVAKKRTWTITWNMIPSVNGVTDGISTADGGYSGSQIEAFYEANDSSFRMVLRNGSAIDQATPIGASTAGTPYEDADFEGVDVMITAFSKEVVKRGIVDLWNMSVTLEEV